MNDLTRPAAERALARKERLRTLENQIRTAAGEIQKKGLEIGRWLCEIRDDELWTEEYHSWSEYLRAMTGELVGKSFSYAAKLIQAAEVAKRLPPPGSLPGETTLEKIPPGPLREVVLEALLCLSQIPKIHALRDRGYQAVTAWLKGGPRDHAGRRQEVP